MEYPFNKKMFFVEFIPLYLFIFPLANRICDNVQKTKFTYCIFQKTDIAELSQQ